MILIVTNKTDFTADFVILELQRRDIEFARFNTEDFPSAIDITIRVNGNNVSGNLYLPDKYVNLDSIISVWYRRPVNSIPATEVQDSAAQKFIIQESKATLDGLWNLLNCFWVSHPNSLRVAESKLFQLKIAASIGFKIPATLVTDNPTEAENFYTLHLKSVIYKPLHQARIIRDDKISLIYSTKLDEVSPEYFQNIKYAPVILQPYIEKSLEIRVTIIGTEVFAVELHSQEVNEAKHDWRRANIGDIKHRLHKLPVEIERKCIKLVSVLGLQFGAIDLILTTDGEYIFLEINPNGQWAWIQQMCPDVLIREALVNLLVRGKAR